MGSGTGPAPLGSSPLARGLQRPSTREKGEPRIIPARAGFTVYFHNLRFDGKDHPRSRGVYSRGCLDRHWRHGSSPLARGLPRTIAASERRSGIIPARAGFTCQGPRRTGRARDHPRSRGVYLRDKFTAPTLVGSSPLARGLREGDGVVSRRRGIIPARAGFTCFRFVAFRVSRDHPRSRGVYHPSAGRRVPPGGSSPLARGLPIPPCASDDGDGIIPARAGFTSTVDGVDLRARDHPRSRGVYMGELKEKYLPNGSSPLARGLLRSRTRPGSAPRIIPARAGFTRASRFIRHSQSDHPRSRGVYPGVALSRAGREGSSPLARGLPASPPS